MKTKTFLAAFWTIAFFLAIFAQSATADVYAVKSTGYGGLGLYHTGQGGEFTLSTIVNGVDGGLTAYLSEYSPLAINTGGTTNTFQTFCLEKYEYIDPNKTYSATISNGTIYGGGGDTVVINGVKTDPLSIGTAWLYYQFATGTLDGYNYTDNRTSSAAALQNTIWWLEGEASDPGSANIFRNAVLAQYGGSVTAAKTDNNGQIGVAVLNLWVEGHADQKGYEKQDQLILTHAPIPAAVWLLGSGFLGLIGIRRKMKA